MLTKFYGMLIAIFLNNICNNSHSQIIEFFFILVIIDFFFFIKYRISLQGIFLFPINSWRTDHKFPQQHNGY